MTEIKQYFMKWFPSAKVDDKYDINMAQISPESCIEFAQAYADHKLKKKMPSDEDFRNFIRSRHLSADFDKWVKQQILK